MAEDFGQKECVLKIDFNIVLRMQKQLYLPKKLLIFNLKIILVLC